MKNKIILGSVLLVLGAVLLSFGNMHYRTEESIIKIGTFEATAWRWKTVGLPPTIGWAMMAGGACVLLLAAARNRI